MGKKELIVPIWLYDTKAVNGPQDRTLLADGDAVSLAAECSNHGADAILLFDLSDGDTAHDAAIGRIKEIAAAVDIPVYGGGNVRRMEDVKKLLYAGCRKAFLNYAKEGNIELAHEVSSRFGREKILACVCDGEALHEARLHEDVLGGIVVADAELAAGAEAVEQEGFSVYLCASCTGQAMAGCGDMADSLGQALLSASGVFCEPFASGTFDFMELKHALLARGIAVNTYEASVRWDEIRTNNDGLLPVVVQDYKTQEVLMVAYMNREAFEATVRTGRMTYWSRSRQELWVKGLTSGHFQYVRELRIDCDNDTLLAKVMQVGAACHTGNRSCFYRTVLRKEYDDTNPLAVFEDVFSVILDRKAHPKEGSYTNYLFDKGIDKILKKVGEEATEIVIAAKNPDPEEIKYEISDFLYHVMVLMAEKGVSWEDITKELARR